MKEVAKSQCYALSVSCFFVDVDYSAADDDVYEMRCVEIMMMMAYIYIAAVFM